MKPGRRDELNGKAPKWFEDWHNVHFRPVTARSKRNERWLVIIITALIATSVIGDKYDIDVVALIEALLG